MTTHISLFQFGCEIFGYDNAMKMNSNKLRSYYDDWKTTTYSIKQYKALLNTRG